MKKKIFIALGSLMVAVLFTGCGEQEDLEFIVKDEVTAEVTIRETADPNGVQWLFDEEANIDVTDIIGKIDDLNDLKISGVKLTPKDNFNNIKTNENPYTVTNVDVAVYVKKNGTTWDQIAFNYVDMTTLVPFDFDFDAPVLAKDFVYESGGKKYITVRIESVVTGTDNAIYDDEFSLDLTVVVEAKSKL